MERREVIIKIIHADVTNNLKMNDIPCVILNPCSVIVYGIS